MNNSVREIYILMLCYDILNVEVDCDKVYIKYEGSNGFKERIKGNACIRLNDGH